MEGASGPLEQLRETEGRPDWNRRLHRGEHKEQRHTEHRRRGLHVTAEAGNGKPTQRTHEDGTVFLPLLVVVLVPDFHLESKLL